MEKKKLKYRFQRSSLQFPKEFIEYLDSIRGGIPKNHFVMNKLGFDGYKDKSERFK